MSDAAGPRSFVCPGGWWVLTLLILIYVQSFVDRTILSALGEPIRHELGLSDTQLGLLGGMAFALTYSILGIPAAFLSERIRRKTLIAGAVLVWSVMTMGCGLAGGFVSLLVMRAGVGIGEAGFTPPAHALISDFFPPERRTFALGLFGAAIPLGVLVAAIGGGWLTHATDWRTTFLVVGAPGLLLAPLLFFTMREPDRGEAEGAPPAPVAGIGQTMRQFFRARSAIPLILAGALAAVPGYALFTFGVSYFVRAHGLSLVSAAIVFGAIVAGGQLIGMILGGAVTERLARGRPARLLQVPVIALVIGSLCQLAAWQQSSLTICLVLVGVGMIFAAAYLGPANSAAHALLTPRTRATGMAIVLLAHTLIGLGFGPPLIGLVSDRVSSGRFGPGFAEACHVAAGHRPDLSVAVPQACIDASADGITAAMSFAAAFGLLAALGFAIASRYFPADAAAAGRAHG